MRVTNFSKNNPTVIILESRAIGLCGVTRKQIRLEHVCYYLPLLHELLNCELPPIRFSFFFIPWQYTNLSYLAARSLRWWRSIHCHHFQLILFTYLQAQLQRFRILIPSPFPSLCAKLTQTEIIVKVSTLLSSSLQLVPFYFVIIFSLKERVLPMQNPQNGEKWFRPRWRLLLLPSALTCLPLLISTNLRLKWGVNLE